MKFIISLLLSAGLMLAAGAEEAAILNHLKEFSGAVLKKDKKALDKLFGDSVVYSHSNGKAETKAEAIAAIEAAKYEQFEFKEQTVQFYGNTAVVRGPAMITNTNDGKKQTLSLSILQVWVKGSKGWQLVARQSTRLP